MDQGSAGASPADLESGEFLILQAPMDGWAAPLSEVPDPVFSDKMMGDGVAIDPTGSVLSAPCDGEIILIHEALHALTLRAANGAEILIHVGLDTVALDGQGFTAHVHKGQHVRAGNRLLSFDLEILAQSARSLITPIVIANGERFSIVRRKQNAGMMQGEELMVLRPLQRAAARAEIGYSEIRREFIVPMAHGLHARPAARLAGLAKDFIAEIAIVAGDKRANARSPVALMGLGLGKGAAAIVLARGADAEKAAAALVALIESGMGESEDIAPVAIVAAPARQGVLTGVRAAPGLGLGIAARLSRPAIIVEEAGQGRERETQSLDAALAMVRLKLGAMRGNATQAAILSAHLSFLDDPELAAHAGAKIVEGKSAGYAWRDAIQAQISVLQGLTGPRFGERAADLLDLEYQVLNALVGSGAAPAAQLPPDTILLAEDVLPSQLAGLDVSRLAGIALAQGGPTSHAAILAASMNIPALVACGPAVLEIADGTALLLDADDGSLVIDPPVALQEAARQRIAQMRTRRAQAQAGAQALCQTRDGLRIEVAANLGAVEDVGPALAAGAEGCGLLRTEFLFLNRQQPPDEAEQTEIYRAIAQGLNGRPLVVRTLDIGGDKPAPYLPFPAEENPALGLRGVRVSLWRPELLAAQLRAILRGIPAAQCRIMVPMIASLSELRAVRRVLDDARTALGIADPVPLGIMVETPAAAMTADILAAEADFFSIGTNDLTQYALAMDRGHAGLAGQFDALHPAVLRLIAATAEGAARHGRHVAVCGGLASDPVAAPILIGLGVRGLSGPASRIADIKAAVRDVTLEDCKRLASKALGATSAAAVRALARNPGE
ncbi:MAG TPA: phosphoenolpyruvate--protein phosphotransferase [Rhizomicrobium sp.]